MVSGGLFHQFGANDLALFAGIVPALAFIFVRSSQRIPAPSGLRDRDFLNF
jgi:hypothetical protein